MISTLIDFLVLNRRDEFVECLDMVYSDLSVEEKQVLLFEIMNRFYTHEHFKEFKEIFDKILKDPINLNFNVNHRAVTFLSLVICKAPYLKLVNYFIKKGACINFTGDVLAFVSKKHVEFAKMHLDGNRYQTCLDFAEAELDNLISKDISFNFKNPGPKFVCEDPVTNSSRMLIDTSEYAELYAQKQYLSRIILTRRICDYLKALGARNYRSKGRAASH